MAKHVEGTFEVTSWHEEQAPSLDDSAKVTRAMFGQRYAGGIDAETVTDSVMTYRDDGTADYVGFQRLSGKLDGRAGTFVLQVIGRYDGNEARASTTVVDGSATDDLTGLRGSGTFAAPHGSTGSFTLDYELD
jgi:hypothetical protein